MCRGGRIVRVVPGAGCETVRLEEGVYVLIFKVHLVYLEFGLSRFHTGCPFLLGAFKKYK